MHREYPGFKAVGEADRVPGNPKDKENYISLLRELRDALKPHNYLLSAAVSAGKKTIDVSYDVKQLNELLDFINVMSYDFHGGAWDNKTGQLVLLISKNETRYSYNYLYS